MTKDEALNLALDFITESNRSSQFWLVPASNLNKTVTAIREALAQPEQEPVAHTLNCVCGAVWDIKSDGSEEMAHTPDTTPPHRKPLSDEMKSQCPYGSILQGAFYDGWLKAEAAHGIKGEA